MSTPQSIPLRTKGRGDCAFHAIFGEWDGIQFQCPNVKTRREIVAACIKTAEAGSRIFSNTIEGIQDIVMADRSMGGHRIRALKEQYRTFSANNQNAIDQSWNAFEAQLQAYPTIVAYIHQFNLERGTSNANLKTEFETCYNEGNQLEGQILAIPELSSSYSQYRMHANVNFWSSVTWDEEIIIEYAECMQHEGTFTLPTDLDTIARVFEVSIAYYTKQMGHAQAIQTEDYNPDVSNPIPICFNGTNHYERMANPKEHRTIHAPSKKKTSSLISTAKPSIKTVANTPSDSSDNISEVTQDKIEDVRTLFQLYLNLETFIEKSKDPSQISLPETTQLLRDIFEFSSYIKWNNESSIHIRNIYGKVFYKTGKPNNEYIDFERLSLPHRFPDKTVLEKINEIFFRHLDKFIRDIEYLRNNILIVLTREFHKHKHLNDPDQCPEIVEYVAVHPIEQEKLLPLDLFLALIDIHYDPLMIQKICQPDLINALNEIDPKDEPLRWRYTFARVLTLIGQASRDLSPTISERYPHLPLKALVNLRNQIAHGDVHRKHVVNDHPESSPLYQLIAQTHLRELQKQLELILKHLPNLPVNDLIPVLEGYGQSALTRDNNPDDVGSELSIIKKIQSLKKREASLKNQNHQILQHAKSTTKKGNQANRNAVNEKRYREKIASLESKEKTESLTEKEQLALTSMKKELEKLERRHQPKTNGFPSAGPTIINKKLTKPPEEIEQELKEIATELVSLKTLLQFDTLLALFKKKTPKTCSREKQPVIEEVTSSSHSSSGSFTTSSSSGNQETTKPKKADRSNTLRYLLNDLRKEYKRMENFNRSNSESGRDFAKEHCMCVIGQLKREIKSCGERLTQKVFNQNPTVRRAFAQTISTRNQMMHDPFNDHTSDVNLTIRDFTLPLSFDLKALKEIHRYESTQEEFRSISSLIGIHRTIGEAYVRLNLLEEAEKHFVKSLNYSSPGNYGNFLIQKLGRQPLGVPQSTSPLGGAIYTVEYEHGTITFEGEPLWIHHRLTTLERLAFCQIVQAKHSTALEHLKECLTIYRNGEFEHAPSRSAILTLYYMARIGMNPKKGKELLQEFTQRYPDDNSGKIQLLIAIIRDKLVSEDYQEGLSLIEEMQPDPDTNTPKPLIVNLNMLNGLLLAHLADQQEIILNHSHNQTTEHLLNPIKIREQAITTLRNAYEYYQAHAAEFRFKFGDKTHCLSDILEIYPSTLRAQAYALVVAFDERQQESYQLIHQAIEFQERHGQDMTLSYITLGVICYKIYTRTHEQKYLEEGLQTYNRFISHQDIVMRALGHLGIGSLLLRESQHLEYFKQRSAETLINLRSALNYFYQIPEEKRSTMVNINIPTLFEFLDEVKSTQAQYIDNDDITIRAAAYVRLGTVSWIKSQALETGSNFVKSFFHDAIGDFGLARFFYFQIPEEQRTDYIRHEVWYIQDTLSHMLDSTMISIDHPDQAISAQAHVRSGAVLLGMIQEIRALDHFTKAKQRYSQISEEDKTTDDRDNETYIQSMQEMLLNHYDRQIHHPNMSIRADGYTGKGAALLSLSRLPEALTSFTDAELCYSQIPQEKKSDYDRENEQFISSKFAAIQSMQGMTEGP